jgi:hypothetical protein
MHDAMMTLIFASNLSSNRLTTLRRELFQNLAALYYLSVSCRLFHHLTSGSNLRNNLVESLAPSVLSANLALSFL